MSSIIESSDAAFANVNVGWGTKETQFHGKAGKDSRTVGQIDQEKVDENDGEKKSIKVVWRDDGQYFAVSYVSEVDQVRRIRVFNREGQLQSTSEPVKQLGPALAWKPSQVQLNLFLSTILLTWSSKYEFLAYVANLLRFSFSVLNFRSCHI